MMMSADEVSYSVVRSESRVAPIRQYVSPQPFNGGGGFIPIINPYPNFARVSRVDTQNPETAEQNYFPSFFRNPTPPSQPQHNSHSRPYKSVPSNSNAASIAGRYSAGRAQNFDQSILGSGDFAVIRGGTFYPEGEDRDKYRFKDSDEFFSGGGFFKNGHGRPNAQTLKAKKQPYFPEDPFEHFTDFADINAGNDAAFSNVMVIYANKNSTKPHRASPKNIFEQLQLLDLEKDQEIKSESITGQQQSSSSINKAEGDDDAKDKKIAKLSKFKTKLAKSKVVKKYKKKLGPKEIQNDPSSLDYTDPLLATS
jgi:hypothetical protein